MLNMLKRSRVALTVVLLVAGVGVAGLRAQPAVATEPSASLDGSLLDRYCVTCHNERMQTAGVVLEGVDVTQVAANAPVLEKVVHKLRSGQMPPMGRPRPEPAVRDAFITGLESALDRAAAASPDPGRIAVHRLNRLEYVNAVRDLVALDYRPRAAAGRQSRHRLRQQRGRAVRHAGADEPLHLGRGQGQPFGHWRPHHPAAGAGVPGVGVGNTNGTDE